MKDAKLVALAEAQWIRSYVRLLMGSGRILGADPMISSRGMSSGLTSLWGCSCLNASKYAMTERLGCCVAGGLEFFFLFFFCGRKLTCPSMPIIPAIRKTDKANHRRVSGRQHIL